MTGGRRSACGQKMGLPGSGRPNGSPPMPRPQTGLSTLLRYAERVRLLHEAAGKTP
jgi:hypothetical protein